ncbi:MAG TPA: polyprenyl synthetase family protein, partial [Candidatus Sulfotelmatobacter sp.]|nr:polyprenyl synthetase family protein [Candidatus Sulfotelmatobacter sp.]
PASSKPVPGPHPLMVPRHIRQQRFRPAKIGIPQTPAERNQLLQFVRHYIAEYNPVPPLPLEQLKEHADRVLQLLKAETVYRDYIGVLINNEMWREPLARVPYAKRLLLLPKCLRVEKKCPAPFDEFGLLCKQCGLCSIQDLQAEAEKLGYAVLVAEGSAVVTSLIQTGKVEAIVGVSCLGVLERAFPYMEAAAVPGLAIPLLQDDCVDTTVDLDWVWDYIHLTSDDQTRRLDLGALRSEVNSWFSLEALSSIMGEPQGETERLGRQWLAQAGKRWRPFLAVAAFQALRLDTSAPLPEDIRKLAVAVECFHKASLIHDDIEDNDELRYGVKTLHAEHGVPVALNIGDLLIGEGYRLIAACNSSAEQKAQMVLVAAQGQRQLCRGQGDELGWAQKPQPLTPLQVLDIFRHKTAPAFEVALKLGALYAEAGRAAASSTAGRSGRYEDIAAALQTYSEALGIAYQIRDDLADHATHEETNDVTGLRPSLLLALAYEKAAGEARQRLDSLWRRRVPAGLSLDQIRALFGELKAEERARTLLETYKEEAIRSLRDLENPNLKGLLRRVIGRIFNHTEIKGWCKEFEPIAHESAPGNAASRAPGA